MENVNDPTPSFVPSTAHDRSQPEAAKRDARSTKRYAGANYGNQAFAAAPTIDHIWDCQRLDTIRLKKRRKRTSETFTRSMLGSLNQFCAYRVLERGSRGGSCLLPLVDLDSEIVERFEISCHLIRRRLRQISASRHIVAGPL